MRIIIKSDNRRYEVIWFMHNKSIDSHIYSSTYDVRAQIILPEQVSVHIQDNNNEPTLILYVSTIYLTYVI